MIRLAYVHQYLIPGVQVGAKVRVDSATGEVLDVYNVVRVRPVTSETGCLLCNKLINSAKLQEESIADEDRTRQRYIDEPEAHLGGEHLAPHAERMAEHLGTFWAQSANDNHQKPRK
jgi:hypothetical protein